MTPPHRPPARGRPPRLTQARVVAMARQIAAERGLEMLTMRRLATTLGVMPNALYTYFPDKAAILDAVLDDLLGDVARPSSRVGWRRGVASLMRSYRGVLLTQAELIPLTVSRPMLGPNALGLREDLLTMLRRGGLDGNAAVIAFLALFAYTTGFVAFEAGRAPGERDTQQRAAALELHDSLPDEAFPSTRALAKRLSKRPGGLEFDRGLEGLIAGVSTSDS